MASLPPGWDFDYDGSRWFYTYKATGYIQYHFPQDGDEFPEFMDVAAPAPELAPEERLESQQQIKRLGSQRRKPDDAQKMRSRMSATAMKPVSNLWEDERGSRAHEREVFQPESFMYLGPGTYADVSPLMDEEDEEARRVVAGEEDSGKDGGKTDKPQKGKGEVSPEGAHAVVYSGAVDAGVIHSGVVDAGTVDAGTVDAGAVDAGTVDAGTVDAGTVDAGAVDAGAVDSGVVDTVDAGTVDAGTVVAGTVVAGVVDDETPPIQEETAETVHMIDGREMPAELSGVGRFDPVGVVAEMATSNTGLSRSETHPDPVEIGDGTILAPVETQPDPVEMGDNRMLAPIETEPPPGYVELPEKSSPVEKREGANTSTRTQNHEKPRDELQVGKEPRHSGDKRNKATNEIKHAAKEKESQFTVSRKPATDPSSTKYQPYQATDGPSNSSDQLPTPKTNRWSLPAAPQRDRSLSLGTKSQNSKPNLNPDSVPSPLALGSTNPGNSKKQQVPEERNVVPEIPGPVEAKQGLSTMPSILKPAGKRQNRHSIQGPLHPPQPLPYPTETSFPSASNSRGKTIRAQQEGKPVNMPALSASKSSKPATKPAPKPALHELRSPPRPIQGSQAFSPPVGDSPQTGRPRSVSSGIQEAQMPSPTEHARRASSIVSLAQSSDVTSPFTPSPYSQSPPSSVQSSASTPASTSKLRQAISGSLAGQPSSVSGRAGPPVPRKIPIDQNDGWESYFPRMNDTALQKSNGATPADFSEGVSRESQNKNGTMSSQSTSAPPDAGVPAASTLQLEPLTPSHVLSRIEEHEEDSSITGHTGGALSAKTASLAKHPSISSSIQRSPQTQAQSPASPAVSAISANEPPAPATSLPIQGPPKNQLPHQGPPIGHPAPTGDPRATGGHQPTGGPPQSHVFQSQVPMHPNPPNGPPYPGYPIPTQGPIPTFVHPQWNPQMPPNPMHAQPQPPPGNPMWYIPIAPNGASPAPRVVSVPPPSTTPVGTKEGKKWAKWFTNSKLTKKDQSPSSTTAPQSPAQMQPHIQQGIVPPAWVPGANGQWATAQPGYRPPAEGYTAPVLQPQTTVHNIALNPARNSQPPTQSHPSAASSAPPTINRANTDTLESTTTNSSFAGATNRLSTGSQIITKDPSETHPELRSEMSPGPGATSSSRHRHTSSTSSIHSQQPPPPQISHQGTPGLVPAPLFTKNTMDAAPQSVPSPVGPRAGAEGPDHKWAKKPSVDYSGGDWGHDDWNI